MGAGRAVHAAKIQGGAPARHRYARGLGRDPVYGRNRMSVGDAAQGLPAVHDGAVLLLPDARPWPARCSERRPGQGVAVFCPGRAAAPTAGIIDSQSVKTTESGGPRGYDAGKKTKGRKRHIVTDTDGNLLGLVTHGADVQDRDGAPRRHRTGLRELSHPDACIRRRRLCRRPS